MIGLVADQIDIMFDQASNSLAVTFGSCATGIISEISLRCEITIDARLGRSLISLEHWPTMIPLQ